MHFSTVVVASLLTAFASAEVAFPAKRSMYFNHLQKREGACGDASKGKCCDAQDMGGKMVYTECPTGECQKKGDGYFCCETGTTCTTFADDCQKSGGHWGDDYVCHEPAVAGGAPFYAPKDQATVVQDAMAAAAETAAAASSAAEATASAILSEASASASAIESAGSELVSSILGGGAEPTGTEDAGAAATGTEAEATGTEVPDTAEATGTETAAGSGLPLPTEAANGAEKVLYSTPALLMAVIAGVFML